MEELTVINTKNFNNKKFENPLQILQIWFSSSFPIGSYVYSHGLEAMIEDKLIKNSDDILDYIKSILFHGTCKNEYIFIKSIYDGLDINDLAIASSPSKERKLETLKMGDAFRKVMNESWGFYIPPNTAFPICVGKAGLYFKIPFDQLIIFYLQSFTSNLINICVKHIPLGQKIGQDCVIESMVLIKNFLKKSINYNLDSLGGISFYGDIYSMKHENLETRMYLT